MFTIDMNCDMGEGVPGDALILPYISSASIACGYHAGDEQTMRNTADLCIRYQVAVGAHPSFNDRENFGRIEMPVSPAACYQLITDQLQVFSTATKPVSLHHVKPHGALYNMAAANRALAAAIATAVRDFDETLILYGLAGSFSISEAAKLGLRTAAEVFADRSYQDHGGLTPRNEPGALIEDTEAAVQQVLQMIKEKTVTTVTGKLVTVDAETICIHGDGERAVDFAKAIHERLKQEGVTITTI
jgi:UPF0271 protein